MIGYYVHHQGEGHATRAAAIARHLGEEPVTGLSSRPRPADWTGDWVQLARDDEPAASVEDEPTAGGALHWAPSGHAGLRERMAQISAWIATHAPALMVIDVSVEVTVLARTMGIPVVTVALPGVRDDPPHQLAYQMATAIIAPWPAWADVLRGGEKWRAKTHAVGSISRFEGRPRSTARSFEDGRLRVLVLSGRGGTELTADRLAAAQRATPGWEWTVLGPPGDRWEADPWPLLCDADVVVTHAGQNAIADVAAARRPAVIVPQPRPFDEQVATAAALRAASLAVVWPAWPVPGDLTATLAAAIGRGDPGWSRWNSGDGAERAAALLREVNACVPR